LAATGLTLALFPVVSGSHARRSRTLSSGRISHDQYGDPGRAW